MRPVEAMISDKDIKCLIFLQVKKWINSETGQSSGCLANSDSLIRAVDAMIRETEVNAVAVVTRFPDDSIEDIIDYRQGEVS